MNSGLHVEQESLVHAGLGKNLKLKIIAEGVEDAKEAALLRDLGCDLVQGYFFAKPMSESDATALTSDWEAPKY